MHLITTARPFYLQTHFAAQVCPVSYPFRNITHVNIEGALFIVELSGGRPSKTCACDFEVTCANTGRKLSYRLICTCKGDLIRYNGKNLGSWTSTAAAVQGVAELAARL